MKNKYISPSLICMDLLNIESEVRELEGFGCRMLHVDVIDGIFSPDMPLGIDMVSRLRAKTDMILDAHLMSVNNGVYVDLLLSSGVNRLCFHPEFEPRPSILLRKIKSAGIKAGLAISPETTIESLEYLLPLCDFVLLMRIDAGYAHMPGQVVYPQIGEKIERLAQYAEKYGLNLEIEVDGRVGFAETEELLAYSVDVFVSGSRGVFSKDGTRKENWETLQNILRNSKEKKHVSGND